MDTAEGTLRNADRDREPAEPNRWVEQELDGMPPGRALDIGAGDGRHAIWLATRGWQVVAVDRDDNALEIGKVRLRALVENARASGHSGPDPQVTWVCADAADGELPGSEYDLVLMSYVPLGAHERTGVLRSAARMVAPGGTLLVVARHPCTLGEAAAGQDAGGGQDAAAGQDPFIHYDENDLEADLRDLISGGALRMERNDRVARQVDNAEAESGEGTFEWDLLARFTRPAAPAGLTFTTP